MRGGPQLIGKYFRVLADPTRVPTRVALIALWIHGFLPGRISPEDIRHRTVISFALEQFAAK